MNVYQMFRWFILGIIINISIEFYPNFINKRINKLFKSMVFEIKNNKIYNNKILYECIQYVKFGYFKQNGEKWKNKLNWVEEIIEIENDILIKTWKKIKDQ